MHESRYNLNIVYQINLYEGHQLTTRQHSFWLEGIS